MKNKINNKKRKISIYKIISVLLFLTILFFLSIIFYINLLPSKYLIIVLILILGCGIFNALCLNLKRLKIKFKKIISIISVIEIAFMIIGSFYICKTLGVLLGNGESKYKLEHYSVIVLKDSKYKSLKDIKGENVGYYKNSTGSKEANEYLKREISIKTKAYNSTDTLVNDLMNSKIKVIILEDSIKNIMDEEITDFSKSIKVIYTFNIKIKNESTLKDVKVTKEPFAVYLSGIDTYGEINSVSRSDVNIVMVVNPKTNQVLLISIPRDYYVQLHGTKGTKDKLTHAGIYGVDMSIKTIEDLLELKINYYLKVNFTSVVDIVNALGGLDVYSEYTFISYSGFTFKKGYNSVNGEQALDFARTRKAFSDGDRQRGKNQQALIESIIRKATNKSIITKYNSLLNAINGKYQTNMSMQKITALIKMQLDNMPSWNITSYSLSGTDSNDYTYTYNQLLYVMKPNQDSVTDAIDLIDKVIAGEKLEGSYESEIGTSNRVGKVKVQSDTPTASVKTDPDIKEKESKKYIITFNSNEGSLVSSETIEESKMVIEPDDPTRVGYVFKGWYLNGKKYNFSTQVVKDITLTAVWEENIKDNENIEDDKLNKENKDDELNKENKDDEDADDPINNIIPDDN